MNNYEPFRPCPICRNRLIFLRRQKDKGIWWDVFECPVPYGCGSEVWIDPYKGQRLGK